MLSAKIVKNAKLKIYPGFPHGTPIFHADVNREDAAKRPGHL
jgi:non-heme chloroperoxidase